MRTRDRCERSHHGFGPVAMWVGLPLLTLVIPVLVLVSGVRRRLPNREGMSIAEFGWGQMLIAWAILLAFVCLVCIPFLALREKARRQRRWASRSA